MDASRSTSNGFSYQEKLSSSKLTSVLEAIAGEYALVINGHSLVGTWERGWMGHRAQLWAVSPASPCSPCRPMRWRLTWR